jgi:hypothetical protein
VSERSVARRVLERTVAQDLSLVDFYDSWPDSDDPLIRAIFEETEDTLEHVPGSWLRRTTDWGRFRESAPYKLLLIDAQLLLDEFASVPSERLVEIRGRLERAINLHQEDEAVIAEARAFVREAASQ